MQYIQDNDDRLPNTADANNPHVTWRNITYPYIKSTFVFQCPERREKTFAPDGFPRAYAVNSSGTHTLSRHNPGQGVFAGRGSVPVSLSSIPSPGDTIALCEITGTDRSAFDIDDAQIFPASHQRLWAGHTNGSNYLFADGHAKWFRPQATQNMWHRNKKIPLSPNGVAILAQTVKAFAQ